MPAVRSLIAAREGGAEGLRALAVALASTLADTPPLPDDPAELWSEVEDRGAEQSGTWQEVRAARDYGDLSDAEYQYLAAAVEALTREDTEG